MDSPNPSSSSAMKNRRATIDDPDSRETVEAYQVEKDFYFAFLTGGTKTAHTSLFSQKVAYLQPSIEIPDKLWERGSQPTLV
jgi:hypothetical protein